MKKTGKVSAKVGEEVTFDVDHIDFAAAYKPHQSAMEVHKKDDNFAYRWARNTPERLHSLRSAGFVPVPASEVDTVLGGDESGRVRVGNNILMKRPKEIEKAHRAFLDRKAASAVAAPRESFKSKARNAHVKTVDTTEAVLAAPSASVPDSDD